MKPLINGNSFSSFLTPEGENELFRIIKLKKAYHIKNKDDLLISLTVEANNQETTFCFPLHFADIRVYRQEVFQALDAILNCLDVKQLNDFKQNFLNASKKNSSFHKTFRKKINQLADTTMMDLAFHYSNIENINLVENTGAHIVLTFDCSKTKKVHLYCLKETLSCLFSKVPSHSFDAYDDMLVVLEKDLHSIYPNINFSYYGGYNNSVFTNQFRKLIFQNYIRSTEYKMKSTFDQQETIDPVYCLDYHSFNFRKK